jgi:hypothetical protein
VGSLDCVTAVNENNSPNKFSVCSFKEKFASPNNTEIPAHLNDLFERSSIN